MPIIELSEDDVLDGAAPQNKIAATAPPTPSAELAPRSPAKIPGFNFPTVDDLAGQDLPLKAAAPPATPKIVEISPNEKLDDAPMLQRPKMSAAEQIGRQGKIAAQNFFKVGPTEFFDFLDRVSTLISEKTGLEKGGLFKKIADLSRVGKEEVVVPADLGEKILAGFSKALSGDLPKAALATSAGGPIAGFGGLSALESASQGAGTLEVIEQGIKGALSGGAFKATAPLNIGPKAVATGAIGATSAAAEGGDAEQIAESAATMGLLGAMGGSGGTSTKDVLAHLIPENLPSRLYQSAVKFQTGKKMKIEDRNARIKTGLKEEIVPSRKGLEKLGERIETLNNTIDSVIKDAAKTGDTVSAANIVKRIDQLKTKFKNQALPSEDLAILDAAKEQFLAFHGEQIPVAKAQAIKRGTYAQLRNKAYGELKSARIEAEKALARGIKEELAAKYPELTGLNAKEGSLIKLNESIEQAVKRIENRDLVGIGSTIAGAAGSAVTGSAKGGFLAMLGKALIDHPKINSRIAIALENARSKAASAPRVNLGEDLLDFVAPSAKSAARGAVDMAGRAVPQSLLVAPDQLKPGPRTPMPDLRVPVKPLTPDQIRIKQVLAEEFKPVTQESLRTTSEALPPVPTRDLPISKQMEEFHQIAREVRPGRPIPPPVQKGKAIQSGGKVIGETPTPDQIVAPSGRPLPTPDKIFLEEAIQTPPHLRTAEQLFAVKSAKSDVIPGVGLSKKPPPAETSKFQLPESEMGKLQKAKEAITERRSDMESRKRVSEMSREEMERSLLTSETAGIPNKRAYNEALANASDKAKPQRKETQVFSDFDGLKWVNDNIGHAAGDAFIRAKAKAIKELGLEGYHLGGDEFAIQFDNPKQAKSAMKQLREKLENAKIEVEFPDGTKHQYTGARFSYGIGQDTKKADSALRAQKQRRTKAGERASRGEKPPGLRRVGDAGRGDIRPGSSELAQGDQPAKRIKDNDNLSSSQKVKRPPNEEPPQPQPARPKVPTKGPSASSRADPQNKKKKQKSSIVAPDEVLKSNR